MSGPYFGREGVKKSTQIEVTCRQVWKHISDYLDHEVSPELREQLERHFSGCHHCTAILDGTRNTIVLMADQRALELPENVSGRLYRRLADHLKLEMK